MAEQPETCERAADYAARYFRWNFGVLLLDACSFFAGLAFFDANTVLPVLLAKLGASDEIIGISRFVQTLGFTLPALIAAHYIHGRARHKPFLLVTCAAARLLLLTLPVAILLFGATRPGLTIVWFLVVLGFFWTMDGACAVSWVDIVAKTIHVRVRGRFFGTMQLMSGVLGIVVGRAVTQILRPGGLPFPQNFALLAACWCAGCAVSQVALHLIREPTGHAVDADDKPSFGAYLKLAIPLLRGNPTLARLVVVRVLVDGAGIATPFYVLYATRDLGAPLAMIGLYQLLQSVGKVLAGPLWGWLTDRFGPPIGLRAVAAAIALIPAVALLTGYLNPWMFPSVFLLLGAVQDGVWMVSSSALLEAVDAKSRPLAVGVASVFQTPSAVYGPLGGLIAGMAGYRTAFGVAAVFGLAGMAMSTRIEGRRPERVT